MQYTTVFFWEILQHRGRMSHNSIAWLKEKKFSEGCFKAGLLNLVTAKKSPRKR
jgi:hypothetical protein